MQIDRVSWNAKPGRSNLIEIKQNKRVLGWVKKFEKSGAKTKMRC